MRSGFSRASLWLAIVALWLGGSSCAKQQQAENSPQPAKETENERPAIPEEFLTQGARLFGAPFEREVHLRLTRSDTSGTQESFVYRTVSLEVRDDAVEVQTKLMNAPEGLGQGEAYELRKDGVWQVAVAGVKFDPAFVAMPADVKVGSKWSYESSASTMKIKATATAVRWEKIKVPLGEFEALRVESTGTYENGSQRGTLKDTSYYVEGLGAIKSETVVTGTVPGQNGQPTKVTTSVKLEAIPEP